MEINNDEVKITFETHPKIDSLHFTSDGQTFFKRDEAASHTRNLEDKVITSIQRHTFFASLAAGKDDTETANAEQEAKEQAEKDAAAAAAKLEQEAKEQAEKDAAAAAAKLEQEAKEQAEKDAAAAAAKTKKATK